MEFASFLWPISNNKLSELYRKYFGRHVLVETSQGPVKGLEITSLFNYKYTSFLGIPYAKPPIGPLRFKVSKVYYFEFFFI